MPVCNGAGNRVLQPSCREGSSAGMPSVDMSWPRARGLLTGLVDAERELKACGISNEQTALEKKRGNLLGGWDAVAGNLKSVLWGCLHSWVAELRSVLLRSNMQSLYHIKLLPAWSRWGSNNRSAPGAGKFPDVPCGTPRGRNFFAHPEYLGRDIVYLGEPCYIWQSNLLQSSLHPATPAEVSGPLYTPKPPLHTVTSPDLPVAERERFTSSPTFLCGNTPATLG